MAGSSATSDLSLTLQREEAQFLQVAGFTVKNTFIVETTFAPELPRRARRAVTAPATKLHALLGDLVLDEPSSDDGDAWEQQQAAEADEGLRRWVPDDGDEKACVDPVDLPIIRDNERTLSGASTMDWELDSQALSQESEGEPMLAGLIRDECAFLRVTNIVLVPLGSEQSAKLPVPNVSLCLRACVQGLPQKKRMKWQNPLAWVVALVLQRAGCPAFVKRNQIYAPLNALSGDFVRIDLCAPRACDPA